MPLFDEQISRRPDHYPWCKQYVDSMWTSFWTPNKFKFESDLQDFKVNMTAEQGDVVTKTLSAIGQIEIAVKTFWIKLGDNLPHPSIKDLGIVMGHVECYSDDTEILTPLGWKLIKDCKIGDSVYQYIDNGTLEVTQVLDTINKPYVGDMYSFGSRSNHCFVTPNHEMLVQREKTTGWKVEKVKAKDLKFHPGIKLPQTVVYKGGAVDSLTPLEKIKIAVQADGTLGLQHNRDGSVSHKGNAGGFTHAFRLSKTRKITRLITLLDQANVRYSVTTSDGGLTQILVQLEVGQSYKNFSDWVNISDKTANWCKEFWEELILWDGNQENYYFSSDKEQVDFCQRVAILAGHNSVVGFTPDFRTGKDQTKYRVSISKEPKLWRRPIDLAHSIEKYDGQVTCVTVPSGNILTRKNGKTFIAGNCIHNIAYEKLLTVLGMNDIFEENLKLPVIEGRVNYLRKYTHKFHSDNKKQYIYALILFTLFVENVSLFSQFYIITWFNRYKNVLKDTAHMVSYTRQEEQVHAQVGIHIINVLRQEYPELFDDELEERILQEAEEAYKAESKIIDWMLESYEEEALNAPLLKEFIKNRINTSLKQIGFKTNLEVDKEMLEQTTWFDEEVLGNTQTDFFHIQPTAYSKHKGTYNEDDLF